MNSEEIRKLLGGYATNTLTESERSELYQAALDDQDLFNALQDEQALRELLADPGSRQAIRQALEQPAGSQRHAAWWRRRWIWGGAVAVAATVIIIAVIHPQRSEPPKRVEIASNQQPTKPPLDQLATQDLKKTREAEPRPEQPLNGRTPNLIRLMPRRSSPPAAPTAVPAQAEPSNKVTAEATTQAVGGVIGGAPAIVGSLVPAPQQALRYSLLKRDPQGLYNAIEPQTELKPGDIVRVNVTPPASGYLSLEKQTPSGEWTRVFPESGRSVAANTSYSIPDSGIVVEDVTQNFRISIAPGPLAPQLQAPARQSRAAAAPAAKETAPLTVEIPIGPGKAP